MYFNDISIQKMAKFVNIMKQLFSKIWLFENNNNPYEKRQEIKFSCRNYFIN